MAWTKVQTVAVPSTGGSSAASISVTVSAIGSGNAVLGIVAWDQTGATLLSVDDDKGNNYNLETSIANAADVEMACAFSLTNITNAPTVITAHFSTPLPDFRGIIVDEFSGGSTASTDERDVHGGQYQATNSGATDGNTSGTFTTTVNGDLIWGGILYQVGLGVDSIGTGFSAGGSTTTDFGQRTEYLTQATAGAGTAATFTPGAAGQGAVTYMIALKPPGGAAPNVPYNPWPQAAPIMAQ